MRLNLKKLKGATSHGQKIKHDNLKVAQLVCRLTEFQGCLNRVLVKCKSIKIFKT